MEPSEQAWKSKEGELWISFTSALRSAGNRARRWARGWGKLGELNKKNTVWRQPSPRRKSIAAEISEICRGFPFLASKNCNPTSIVRHPRCKNAANATQRIRGKANKHMVALFMEWDIFHLNPTVASRCCQLSRILRQFVYGTRRIGILDSRVR
jgi:hypothetical protein